MDERDFKYTNRYLDKDRPKRYYFEDYNEDVLDHRLSLLGYMILSEESFDSSYQSDSWQFPNYTRISWYHNEYDNSFEYMTNLSSDYNPEWVTSDMHPIEVISRYAKEFEMPLIKKATRNSKVYLIKQKYGDDEMIFKSTFGDMRKAEDAFEISPETGKVELYEPPMHPKR